MEYDRQFYLNTHKLNQQAANVVLPIIFDITPVRSAVDVGCGVGTWLYSAEKLGVETILGIDGPSLDKNLAIVDEKFIETHDLEYEIKIGSKFDLAISLEVAEHLSDERADGFVGDLCALSDLVLFSAAIPGQGGTHHVNEKWQSYWAQRFEQRSFRAYDIVRWKIWSREDVATWYRQNTIVYCRAESGWRTRPCNRSLPR